MNGTSERPFQGPTVIKVDLDTPLEKAWNGLAAAAFVIAAVLLKEGLLGGKHHPPDPAAFGYLPYPLLMGAVFLLLRQFTDNFYLFDRDRKVILFHFECAVIRSVREYLRFDEIRGVGVNGEIFRSKHSSWYEYRIEVWDRHRQRHAMSDWSRDPQLEHLNHKAEAMARLVECPFLPGSPEHKLETSFRESETGGMVLRHVPLDAKKGTASEVSLVNVFVGVVIALMLLGTVVVLLSR